jgi:patatin-like phospholipase/acyl hydrolase
MPIFTILSIDGGGIRGIIPALILAEIERRTGHRIAEMFDMIAGTSTGGMLALGLTVPQTKDVTKPKYKATQLVSFYEEDGKEVFHSSWQDAVTLRGIINERYSSGRFEKVLKKYLGDDVKLSQAITELLITSYEIETCRPFFFTRRKARAKRTSRLNPRMWEVARSTSAAPTYFSPFRINRSRPSHLPPLTFIDAGIFVNNPTLCAYAEAVNMHSRQLDAPSSDVQGGVSKQSERPVEVRSEHAVRANEVDYVVVSLGTGELNVSIRYEEAKRWGTLHWARPLIDIAYDGSSDTVDGQMRQLMQVVKRPYLYYRFQASLSEANNGLDDTSDWNIQDLKRRAESIFDDPEKLEKIENLCQLLRTRFAESKAGRP